MNRRREANEKIMAGTTNSRFTVQKNLKQNDLVIYRLFRLLGGTTNSEIDQNWM
jgi:hypothetical protein